MQVKDYLLAKHSKFKLLPTPFKLYATGYASAGLGLILAMFGFKAASALVISLLGLFLVLVAAGFAWWSAPFVKRAWDSAVGKVVIPVAHLLALLVTTIFSRHLVSAATGLPPQDFDLAVYALNFIFYIPIWILFASVLIFVIGSVVVVGDMLRSGIPIPRSKHANERGAHASGAIIFALLALLLIAFILPSAKVQKDLILRVVYETEYFQAARYPGVRPFEKVRFHENGIVSTARLTQNGVEISVDKWSCQ